MQRAGNASDSTPAWLLVCGVCGGGGGRAFSYAPDARLKNFWELRDVNNVCNKLVGKGLKKLKEITQVNKQIYNRLNTQKSFYSNSDLNKSYESTKEIK